MPAVRVFCHDFAPGFAQISRRVPAIARVARVTSRMREKRIRRAGLAAGLALTLATVAGCSSDGGDNDEPINTGDQSSASPDAEGGEAEDESALVALYEAYWDAMVELQKESDALDASLLNDVATRAVIEAQLSRIDTYFGQGIFREGAPTIENVTVTVDGDEGRIEACKNEADWPLLKDGEPLEGGMPVELTETRPSVVTAERSADGDWLINATLPVEEATITC